MNNLDILAGEIHNPNLNAPKKDKVFFYADDEWKYDHGKFVVIVRVLYGLKSNTLAWRNYLSEILGNHFGLQSSWYDTDVCFKESTDKAVNEYYTYIIVYVDDLLIADKEPQKHTDTLESKFTVKTSNIGEPKVYLGSNFGKVLYVNGYFAWTVSYDLYVKEAIKNVNKRLKEYYLEYNNKLSDVNFMPNKPFWSVYYRPELDTSMQCNYYQVLFNHNIIGVLRWIIELGRIEIEFEVSYLSRYLAFPRTGHMVQALHVFKYV